MAHLLLHHKCERAYGAPQIHQCLFSAHQGDIIPVVNGVENEMQVADSVGAIPERSKDKRSFDLGVVVSSEAFWPAVIVTLGFATIFWGLFTFTYSKWI